MADGEQFTLADLDLATFIARLDGMTLVEPWLAERPHAQAWWQAVKARPSYRQANVGPSGEETEPMRVEGARIVEAFNRKRAEYVSRYGAG